MEFAYLLSCIGKGLRAACKAGLFCIALLMSSPRVFCSFRLKPMSVISYIWKLFPPCILAMHMIQQWSLLPQVHSLKALLLAPSPCSKCQTDQIWSNQSEQYNTGSARNRKASLQLTAPSKAKAELTLLLGEALPQDCSSTATTPIYVTLRPPSWIQKQCVMEAVVKYN